MGDGFLGLGQCEFPTTQIWPDSELVEKEGSSFAETILEAQHLCSQRMPMHTLQILKLPDSNIYLFKTIKHPTDV